jgi:23S rRNA pseudouridine2605 synthase
MSDGAADKTQGKARPPGPKRPRAKKAGPKKTKAKPTEAEQAGETGEAKGERIAKAIARAGFCSRREAERLIEAGRVRLNGRVLASPAVTVGPDDRIEIDGAPLAARERTRLWLFHKPKGLVTTNRDPEGRPTIFSALPADLPRVMTVGRLDMNTEGLMLLTNDGGLARVLELPATGWMRRYRVRVHGQIEQAALDALKRGITVDGMVYGAIEAEIDRVQGTNVWLTIAIREGKNREVRRVLEHLGLTVTRLIRVSYGPFQLGDIEPRELREVRGRVLRDQLGEKLARAAGADFEAPLRELEAEPKPATRPPRSASRRKPETPKRPRKPAGLHKPAGPDKPAGPHKPAGKSHAHRRRTP